MKIDANVVNGKNHEEISDELIIPAGSFSAWLKTFRKSLAEGTGVDVECGDCIGCCTSSYFIHIRPEEKMTLSSIPDKLKFPAPCLPKGNVVLGFDQNGKCPMFKNGFCSIYDRRPFTCRIYDCRIFTATGISPGKERELICNRVKKWRFEFSEACDRDMYDALRATASFLSKHPGCFPDGFVPDNPSRLAVMAIKVYHVFLIFLNEKIDLSDEKKFKRIVSSIIEEFETFS